MVDPELPLRQEERPGHPGLSSCGTRKAAPASVGVDTGLLDDRSPLVDLGLQVLTQHFRDRDVSSAFVRYEVVEALLEFRISLSWC